MIPAEKQYEFAQLVKYATYRKSKAWDDLVDYVGQSNALMPFPCSDFNDGLVTIYDLFSLPQSPQFWSPFEEKLILFLKQSIWSQVDYESLNSPNFPRYFIQHYLARNRRFFNDSMYNSWIDSLVKYGIPESEIWLAIHDDWHVYGSLRDYIVKNSDKHLSFLSYNFCHSLSFIVYLIEYQPLLIDRYLDRFLHSRFDYIPINILLIDRYLDRFMIYKSPINGEQSIPRLTKPMKQYLMINPEKHESNLVGFLSYKMDNQVVFELTDFIKNNYLDKYTNQIELHLKNHIYLIINDLYQISSTIFINFLDYFLANNSPEIAFKISGKYLNKFKNANSESVKTWLKKLKIYQS